jgi:hypothetical protein
LGLEGVPAAEKFPKVIPLDVGGGVGSVVPVVVVTLAKVYVEVKG